MNDGKMAGDDGVEIVAALDRNTAVVQRMADSLEELVELVRAMNSAGNRMRWPFQ